MEEMEEGIKGERKKEGRRIGGERGVEGRKEKGGRKEGYIERAVVT